MHRRRKQNLQTSWLTRSAPTRALKAKVHLVRMMKVATLAWKTTAKTTCLSLANVRSDEYPRNNNEQTSPQRLNHTRILKREWNTWNPSSGGISMRILTAR